MREYDSLALYRIPQSDSPNYVYEIETKKVWCVRNVDYAGVRECSGDIAEYGHCPHASSQVNTLQFQDEWREVQQSAENYGAFFLKTPNPESISLFVIDKMNETTGLYNITKNLQAKPCMCIQILSATAI
jgi:hypothetical protein